MIFSISDQNRTFELQIALDAKLFQVFKQQVDVWQKNTDQQIIM